MADPSPPLPQHRSARLLIVDGAGRLLLFRYADGRHPPFWATVGGRLLPGEGYEQAAARELAEETGFDAPIGPMVRTRDEVFAVADEPPAHWLEQYFAVRVPRAAAPDPAGWTDEERRTIRQARWWSLAELRETGEPLLPAWLPDALAQLLAADPPPPGAPIDPADDPPVLGLERGAVRLAPHNARWAKLYAEEEARLRQALDGLLLDIQHFGSTSIPGIHAKPILDILAGVRRREDVLERRAQLQALGYGYVPGAGVPGHHVFGKGAPRTHLLHVVEHGGPNWTENLRFRDRLRADPALAAEYDALKLRLADAHPGDRARYTEEKGAFVQRIRRGES